MWPTSNLLQCQRSNSASKAPKTPATSSPTDSGYASLNTSPERENTKPRSPRYFDGPSSFDSSLSDGEDSTVLNISPPSSPTIFETPCPRAVSPQWLGTKSDLAIPSSFHSDRDIKLTKRLSRSQSTPQRRTAIKFADRFVPSRDQHSALSEKFQTTKPITELSPVERLLRRNDATPDAFCFRRQAAAPMASEYRSTSSELSRHRHTSECLRI